MTERNGFIQILYQARGETEENILPDPAGPLSAVVPSSTIETVIVLPFQVTLYTSVKSLP